MGRRHRFERRRRRAGWSHLGDGKSTGLASPEKFAGYTGELGSPDWSVLLVNNGLHIEILIDPESPVGSTDNAGIKDVVLESAITTIHGLRGLGGRRRRRRQGARATATGSG